MRGRILRRRLPQITGVAVSACGSRARSRRRWRGSRRGSSSTSSRHRCSGSGRCCTSTRQGTVVSGMADLIVHTADGAWIVDHKSDAIEDPVQAFLKYEVQLQAYADAIAATGTPVAGVAVHWVQEGGGCDARRREEAMSTTDTRRFLECGRPWPLCAMRGHEWKARGTRICCWRCRTCAIRRDVAAGGARVVLRAQGRRRSSRL